MKIAIIAIAKNENNYINEWIDYHLNLGFDNIIICDNDDELVLTGIVKDSRVIIEDWTNYYGVQLPAYRETFTKYRNDYDWVLFIDIDEFLILENHTNVKDFISSFDNDVQCINLCWKHFGDERQLNVVGDDYSVFNRFKTVVEPPKSLKMLVKAFIKTNIPEESIKRISQHSINDFKIKSVNVLGQEHHGRYIKNIIYKNAWINHYPTKTIGEYVRQKYFRGGPNRNNIKYHCLKNFFEYNTWTQEKEDYAKKLIAEYENTHNGQ